MPPLFKDRDQRVCILHMDLTRRFPQLADIHVMSIRFFMFLQFDWFFFPFFFTQHVLSAIFPLISFNNYCIEGKNLSYCKN